MDDTNHELKQQAEEEASSKTNLERQRIDYYRSLRYAFVATTVDSWLAAYYNKHKAIFKPQKSPTTSPTTLSLCFASTCCRNRICCSHQQIWFYPTGAARQFGPVPPCGSWYRRRRPFSRVSRRPYRSWMI